MFKLTVQPPTPDHAPYIGTGNPTGLDIRAYLPNKELVIKPKRSALVPTGLKIDVELPVDEFSPDIQIRGRSGMGCKDDIQFHVGTIDTDYRGEICVKLFNFSSKPYTIKDKDRIAQLVVGVCMTPKTMVSTGRYEVVEKLPERVTERGEQGFGSSGKQ